MAYEIAKPDQLDIEVEIDLAVLVRKLATDPTFIKLVSEAVRVQQSKDVRKIGNNLGKWAQKQPAPKTTRNRLQ